MELSAVDGLRLSSSSLPVPIPVRTVVARIASRTSHVID